LKHPLEILQTYWGHTSFRQLQEEIITSILDGRDTIALLPTGGGKSVCFQVPAMVMEGICIVISPLVALMTDQVGALKEKGIKALHLSGGLSPDDLTALLDNALFGNYKFLYLSPERLQQEQVQNALRKMNINLIAIDEAHCISQWGNDFRPSYKHINVLRELHPYIPMVALTATATREVLADTMLQLKLEEPQVFKKSFARSNISYRVIPQSDKNYALIQLLQRNDASAIVYVRSRKQAEVISGRLNQQGISADFYHGGLPPKLKQQKLEAWKSYRVSTMVATNAFGMGIDHPSVRFVAHIQLPESLESYFQEAGRAGRDGKNAVAVIFYDESDKAMLQRQFVETLPSLDDMKLLYRKLNNYFQIPYGEGAFTEHSFSFARICQTYDLPPLITLNALTALDRLGIIQLSKQFGRKSKIQFLISSKQLIDEFEKNTAFSVVGKTILRIYGGIFESPNAIDLDLISNKSGIPPEKIIQVLKDMENQGLLSLNLFETDATITFLVPREDDRTLNPFGKTIAQLNEKKTQQVAAVLRYIDNNKVCKQLQLLEYFGEENTEACGNCSVCLNKIKGVTKVQTQEIAKQIIDLLRDEPMDSRTLIENSTFGEKDVLQVLQWLLDRKKVHINAINQYFSKE
jgi:ATP-dependent DNA helicase RecQ